MMTEIKQWEQLTNNITEQWIREVFEIETDEEIYFDWVSVGGVFEFADYWFSFDNILEYYKHNINKEQLFTWYDYCLENQKVNISLAKFILSPAEKEEQERKQIEELRERVESAKKEFEEALNKWDAENVIE